MLKVAGRITDVTAASATLSVLLLLAPAAARAQATSPAQTVGAGAKAESAVLTAEPAFSDYKGVKLGMSAEEVRRLLGNPKEKGKGQDLFVFSDTETAQVVYDGGGHVTAVAVTYYGLKSGAPTPESILGMEIGKKDNGSIYHLERYPRAGYWVSYSRTGGDAPTITIAMQKLP